MSIQQLAISVLMIAPTLKWWVKSIREAEG